MDKVDYLEKNLARQLSWIQAADTRIALLLPLTTAMVGVLAALLPPTAKWTISLSLPTSFAVFFLVLCVIFTACASFPRTNGPKGSGLFFSGIISRSDSQFSKYVIDLEEQDYLSDLASQCYINAQIAERKFTWVKRAMSCLFLSSLPWVLAIYFLYQVKYGVV